jgi:hypothetical protein
VGFCDCMTILGKRSVGLFSTQRFHGASTLHGKAFATHDRQDTTFNIRGFAALSGTLQEGEAICCIQDLSVFSFLLRHFVAQSNGRKRSNEAFSR